MNTLATLWVGTLGPIELASLASFQRQGQSIIIYSYGPLKAPTGIEVRDANEVLPTERIAYYAKENNPSLHSNMFRYHLQAATDFTWVDLDIIAHRPFHFETDRVYGWQRYGDLVNCAVLRLPSDCPELTELLKFKPGMRGIPPHITGLRRRKYQIKTLGRGLPIEKWIWGATGPKALTIALQKNDGLDAALPVEAFYPVPVAQTVRFITPGAFSEADIDVGTYGVHLSKSVVERTLRADFQGRLPKGCYLDQQIRNARSDGLEIEDLYV
jgi:hypothetical protein